LDEVRLIAVMAVIGFVNERHGQYIEAVPVIAWTSMILKQRHAI